MTKRPATTIQKKTRGKYSKSACQACRKAHVKCSGERPCERCKRKQITCVEQVARRSRRERQKVDNCTQTSSEVSALLSSLHASSSNAVDTEKFLAASSSQIASCNPDLYPQLQSLPGEVQNSMMNLFQMLTQHHQLLSRSIVENNQLKHSLQQQQQNHQQKEVSSASCSEEAFARCFSSSHLPVLVLDRPRASSFFKVHPNAHTGSIFCNQAFGQMLQVDISKFTSPSFDHRNVGTWAWNSIMNSNSTIHSLSSFIFEKPTIEYVQFKSILQDSHGHHFFANAKVHLFDHFVWVVFEPAAFIDDELQINHHVHHSTKKFRDINLWKEWICAPNSLDHLTTWTGSLFPSKKNRNSSPVSNNKNMTSSPRDTMFARTGTTNSSSFSGGLPIPSNAIVGSAHSNPLLLSRDISQSPVDGNNSTPTTKFNSSSLYPNLHAGNEANGNNSASAASNSMFPSHFQQHRALQQQQNNMHNFTSMDKSLLRPPVYGAMNNNRGNMNNAAAHNSNSGSPRHGVNSEHSSRYMQQMAHQFGQSALQAQHHNKTNDGQRLGPSFHQSSGNGSSSVLRSLTAQSGGGNEEGSSHSTLGGDHNNPLDEDSRDVHDPFGEAPFGDGEASNDALLTNDNLSL